MWDLKMYKRWPFIKGKLSASIQSLWFEVMAKYNDKTKRSGLSSALVAVTVLQGDYCTAPTRAQFPAALRMK